MSETGVVLKRIVLVHGAGHGAWCWERLTPLLVQRGFEVDTLDLPGLGADRTPATEVTLDSYSERAVSVVAAKPDRVLLVGHSMGGFPISGAAERLPERIGRLVYLASLIPSDGEVMGALASSLSRFEGPSAFEIMRPGTVPGAHDFDLEGARSVFYNTCSDADARAAARQLRPQADAPLAQAMRLSPQRFGAIPKTYIVCSQDRALPPAAQHWFADRIPGVKKRVMNTDHSPFYSDPEGLARILAEEARI